MNIAWIIFNGQEKCTWKPTTKPSKYTLQMWCHLQCRVDNANLHTYKQDRTILPCWQCCVAISVRPDIVVEDIYWSSLRISSAELDKINPYSFFFYPLLVSSKQLWTNGINIHQQLVRIFPDFFPKMQSNEYFLVAVILWETYLNPNVWLDSR